MSRPAAYGTAALRHWRDAQVLEQTEEGAQNADQLYGFAAECALKEAMVRMELSRAKDVPAEHRVHMPRIAVEFMLALGTRQQARVLRMLPLQPMFQDWDVHDRYAGAFQPQLAEHRDAALVALALLQEVELDLGLP